MGQKTNKQTLYKNQITNNFYFDKAFLKHYFINKSLLKLLFIKGALILKLNITLTGNKFIVLYYFYLFSRKITFYKRLGLNKLSNLNNFKINIFENIFKKDLQNLRINYLKLHFCCLNNKINKTQLIFTYNLFKKYINLLFVKNFNLFIDFIKIVVLFNSLQLEIKSFTSILSAVFKNLHKKLHSRYFVFINTLVNFLCKNKFSNNILGIKLKISGKLKGKPIASNYVYLKGQISTQTFASNIKYVQEDIFTKYGVFGLKFWIRYK